MTKDSFIQEIQQGNIERALDMAVDYNSFNASDVNQIIDALITFNTAGEIYDARITELLKLFKDNNIDLADKQSLLDKYLGVMKVYDKQSVLDKYLRVMEVYDKLENSINSKNDHDAAVLMLKNFSGLSDYFDDSNHTYSKSTLLSIVFQTLIDLSYNDAKAFLQALNVTQDYDKILVQFLAGNNFMVRISDETEATQRCGVKDCADFKSGFLFALIGEYGSQLGDLKEGYNDLLVTFALRDIENEENDFSQYKLDLVKQLLSNNNFLKAMPSKTSREGIKQMIESIAEQYEDSSKDANIDNAITTIRSNFDRAESASGLEVTSAREAQNPQGFVPPESQVGSSVVSNQDAIDRYDQAARLNSGNDDEPWHTLFSYIRPIQEGETALGIHNKYVTELFKVVLGVETLDNDQIRSKVSIFTSSTDGAAFNRHDIIKDISGIMAYFHKTENVKTKKMCFKYTDPNAGSHFFVVDNFKSGICFKQVDDCTGKTEFQLRNMCKADSDSIDDGTLKHQEAASTAFLSVSLYNPELLGHTEAFVPSVEDC